jgi:hypothetical protein
VSAFASFTPVTSASLQTQTHSSRIGFRDASNLALVIARGMIEGFDQPTFDGSEFFLGQPTLAMHFSHLHQHSALVFGRILMIAKPCSDTEQEPGSYRDYYKQDRPPEPTGLEDPGKLFAVIVPQRPPPAARLPLFVVAVALLSDSHVS